MRENVWKAEHSAFIKQGWTGGLSGGQAPPGQEAEQRKCLRGGVVLGDFG